MACKSKDFSLKSSNHSHPFSSLKLFVSCKFMYVGGGGGGGGGGGAIIKHFSLFTRPCMKKKSLVHLK